MLQLFLIICTNAALQPQHRWRVPLHLYNQFSKLLILQRNKLGKDQAEESPGTVSSSNKVTQ